MPRGYDKAKYPEMYKKNPEPNKTIKPTMKELKEVRSACQSMYEQTAKHYQLTKDTLAGIQSACFALPNSDMKANILQLTILLWRMTKTAEQTIKDLRGSID